LLPPPHRGPDYSPRPPSFPARARACPPCSGRWRGSTRANHNAIKVCLHAVLHGTGRNVIPHRIRLIPGRVLSAPLTTGEFMPSS
jgi:hypothetical protein